MSLSEARKWNMKACMGWKGNITASVSISPHPPKTRHSTVMLGKQTTADVWWSRSSTTRTPSPIKSDYLGWTHASRCFWNYQAISRYRRGWKPWISSQPCHQRSNPGQVTKTLGISENAEQEKINLCGLLQQEKFYYSMKIFKPVVT